MEVQNAVWSSILDFGAPYHDLELRIHLSQFLSCRPWKTDICNPIICLSVGMLGTVGPCDIMNDMKEWLGGLKVPRDWGDITKKLLKRTKAGNAKALRAHDALVLWQSGLFSFLAGVKGPTPEAERRRRPFAILMGDLTTIVRELTSTEIDMSNMDKLDDLINRTCDAIENHCSYDFLVMNTHLLRHLAEQVRLNGPLNEQMMFAFESSFGANKKVKKNMAHIVASMFSWISKKRTMRRIMGMRKLVMKEPLPNLEEHPILPQHQEIEVLGEPTKHILTTSERNDMFLWMVDNLPGMEQLENSYQEYYTEHNKVYIQ